MVAIDLPAHGESEASSLDPPGFAADLAALFDELGLNAPAIVGHSVGGWTALELAKLRRAGAVLALAPAGLWSEHSPLMTDIGLQVNWRLGQILGGLIDHSLKTRIGRSMGLRSVSVRAGQIPYDTALAAAHDAVASQHFLAHFKATRILRFTGGRTIPSSTPVRVVWGDKDRVALKRRSRHTDELPDHATFETWPDCGHMVMWDRTEDTITAALKTAPSRRG